MLGGGGCAVVAVAPARDGYPHSCWLLLLRVLTMVDTYGVSAIVNI